MPKDPVWRGPKTLQPGKVNWDFQATKVVAATEFNGPYETCLAQRPVIGQSINGIGYGVKVISCKIDESDGGAGIIKLVLEAEQSNSEYSTEPIGEPIYEVEAVELQKPLEQHPQVGILSPVRQKFNEDGFPDPDKGKQRTWDNWPELTDADSAPPGVAFDYFATGSVTLAKYKELREKGVESWATGYPVARRTSYYIGQPQTFRIYVRQTPPIACGAPTGYQYLRTADRVAREGRRCTRVEEWTGAEEWDSLLYPIA